MYGWLKALPDDTLRRSPMLSVFYGDMLMPSGDLVASDPDWMTRNARSPACPTAKLPLGRTPGAPDVAGHHRHLPRLVRPGPRRYGRHGGTRPARARPGRTR